MERRSDKPHSYPLRVERIADLRKDNIMPKPRVYTLIITARYGDDPLNNLLKDIRIEEVVRDIIPACMAEKGLTCTIIDSSMNDVSMQELVSGAPANKLNQLLARVQKYITDHPDDATAQAMDMLLPIMEQAVRRELERKD